MTYPTDEELMALADNALPLSRSAEVEALVARDGALRQRVEMFRASRRAIAASLGPLAEEPVPEALQDAVRSMIDHDDAPANQVLPFVRKTGSGKRGLWPMGLAASLVAAIAGIAGYTLGMRGEMGRHAAAGTVGAVLPPDLSSRLDALPSGAETTMDRGQLRIMSTVRTQDDVLCREFEVDAIDTGQTTLGVACQTEGQWRLEIAVAAPASAEGFAPASSLSTVTSYLDAIGATDPLESDADENALKGLRKVP
ncbi:MAG: anti-sigma factor family protein [Aestuariivirga sp.]